MIEPRLSKAETRILEKCWKLGTASVREILESLREDKRVAYTTVQTLIYRLEEKGVLRKVKKKSVIPNSFSRPSIRANTAAAWCGTCWTCLAGLVQRLLPRN